MPTASCTRLSYFPRELINVFLLTPVHALPGCGAMRKYTYDHGLSDMNG
jgi:hypothetical protein